MTGTSNTSPETTHQIAAAPPRADDDPAPRTPSSSAGLLVIRRPFGRAGEWFALRVPTTTLGRAPDCDIVLDDVTVSRRHAECHRDGDRCTFTDLGSLNGSYVNRQVVDRRELADGGEIWLGQYHLIFCAPSDVAASDRATAHPGYRD